MINNIRFYILGISYFSIFLFIILIIGPIIYKKKYNIDKEMDLILKTIINMNCNNYNFEKYYNEVKQKNKNIELILLDMNSNNYINSNNFLYKEYNKEIVRAKIKGFGKSVKFLEKGKKINIIFAKQWGEYIIIISRTINILDSEAYKTIILLLILLLIMILIIQKFSKKVVKKIEYELYNYINNICYDIEDFFKDDITSISKRNSLKEVFPLLKKFEFLLSQKKKYMEEIKNKQQDIEKIVNFMNEGLIILDTNYNILLSNKEGLKAFGLKKISSKNFTHIYRCEKFLEGLKEAYSSNKNVVFDIDKKKEEVYRVNLNYIPDKGYTIFTTNVTHILKLEKMKSEFSANVSHEIKTPITSILGFAELISKGMVTEPNKIKEYSYKIFKESKRLIDLIDDILKLSKIENTEFVEVDEVEILFVLDNVLDIIKEEIEIKDINVSVEGKGCIKMEYNHILELLINLVENAIKYNKKNGNIFIKIEDNNSEIKISIRDTGIGIPINEVDRIFERFYRVDEVRNKKISGTGLGLSIVKHIVELYNGNIKVRNYNDGSEFIVRFNKQ